jgi:hypothetical protein
LNGGVPMRADAHGRDRQERAMIIRLSLAALFALAAAPALAAPFAKSFKDWDAVCDNVGDCVAHGFEPYMDRRHGVFLRLDMKAGGEARPKLTGAAKGVDLDAARIAEAPPELVGRPLVEQLLAVARKEEKATLTSPNPAEKVVFSLAGLAAALLAIDEHQGRIGTATALIRPGPKPAAAVPGPKPPPRLVGTPTDRFGEGDEALARALAGHLGKRLTEDCDRQESSPGAGEVHKLSKTLSLVGLWCNSGAYNFSSRFWLVSGRDVKGARPVMFRKADGRSEAELVNADYAAKEGVLSYFGKGRGPGDCGNQGAYAWTGRGFELMREAQMLACNGVGGGEDGDLDSDGWPTLWRTRK